MVLELGLPRLPFEINLLEHLVAVRDNLPRRVPVMRCWRVGACNGEKAKVDDEPSMRWKARYRDCAFQSGQSTRSPTGPTALDQPRCHRSNEGHLLRLRRSCCPSH